MRYLNKFFFVGLLAGIALTLAIIDAGGYYFQRRRLSDLMVNRKALGIGRFKFSYAKSSERFPHPWFPSVGQRVGLNSYAIWSLRALDGHRVMLRDFRGKVVFLTFWATWCGPCVGEMPGIQALADSLKNEPVAFLMITDEDEITVRNFIGKMPFRVPVYLGEGDVPPEFDTWGIPRTYILNREGAIVFQHVGGANWDDDSARNFIHSLL